MRWNCKKTAALLKIDYTALLYKMKKLGIQAGPDRETAMNDSGDAGAGAAPLAEINSTGQVEACRPVRRALAGQFKLPGSPPPSTCDFRR
jgi:hypothetical protein